MSVFFPIVLVLVQLFAIFTNGTVVNVPGFNWKYRNKKQACKSGILFQHPIGNIVAIVTMLLCLALLLFHYFIVGSENEDHVFVFLIILYHLQKQSGL